MTAQDRQKGCLPQGPISPFDIACASYLYEAMTDYARSLDRLRERIDTGRDLDLTEEDQRRALLKFLNDWGCRNLARDWHWLAAREVERWYRAARERLDGLDEFLASGSAKGRRDLIDVFDELSTHIVSRRTSKGGEVSVSFGPTATSKTLFVLRPNTFPAWDRPIRNKLGYEGDGESYAQFVEDIHSKIDESKQHFEQGGFAFASLPQQLRRPDRCTVVQLFAEYYWVTLTRGVSLRSRDEIVQWASW